MMPRYIPIPLYATLRKAWCKENAYRAYQTEGLYIIAEEHNLK